MPQIGASPFPEDELLTPDDLAKLLNIKKESVYDRRRKGGDLPPSLTIGRNIRWRRSDVARWLNEKVEAST